MVVPLDRVAKLGWAVLLALTVSQVALVAQSVQTSPAVAGNTRSLILLTDAMRHGISAGAAQLLDRLFLVWAVLAVASLGAVIGDAAHARRASWRVYFAWVLTALPFGPIAAALYFPYGRLLALGTLRKERDPVAIRIIAHAVFAATGPVLGVEAVLVLLHYATGGPAVPSATALATASAAALLLSWLAFRGTLECEAPSPRPRRAVVRSLPLTMISTLLSLGAILSVLALTQARWPSLFHPASIVFHAAIWASALGAAILNVPYSAWRALKRRPTWPPS